MTPGKLLASSNSASPQEGGNRMTPRAPCGSRHRRPATQPWAGQGLDLFICQMQLEAVQAREKTGQHGLERPPTTEQALAEPTMITYASTLCTQQAPVNERAGQLCAITQWWRSRRRVRHAHTHQPPPTVSTECLLCARPWQGLKVPPPTRRA